MTSRRRLVTSRRRLVTGACAVAAVACCVVLFAWPPRAVPDVHFPSWLRVRGDWISGSTVDMSASGLSGARHLDWSLDERGDLHAWVPLTFPELLRLRVLRQRVVRRSAARYEAPAAPRDGVLRFRRIEPRLRQHGGVRSGSGGISSWSRWGASGPGD